MPRVILAVALVLLAAGAMAAMAHHASMSAMGGMPMPGGWVLSGVWLRMCGQTWPAATASFLGMWALMVGVMMLPVLMPALWRCQRAAQATGAAHPVRLVSLVAVNYLIVWTAWGLLVYPLGIALAAMLMQWHAAAHVAPLIAGIVLLGAGALQASAWKARHLARCRREPGGALVMAGRASLACRHGLRLGLHCSAACLPVTAGMLVLGVMEAAPMAVATGAIALERLAPARVHAQHVVGLGMLAFGAFQIARAVLAG